MRTNFQIQNIICGVLFLLFVNQLSAQTSPDSLKEVRLNKEYFKSYWTDTKKIAGAPFHWDKKNWIIAGSVLTGTILLYTQDENVRNVFQRNKSSFIDNTSKYFFDPLGSGLITIPLMGSFFLYGKICRSPKAVRVSLNSAKAFILTGAFTFALKQLTHRHRPNQDIPANPKLWEGPIASYNYDAFPSGHTSTVFAVATVFSLEYRDKFWVPVLAYTLASGVGLSRIYDDEHWASDVLFGAAFGYGIGRLVYWSSIHKHNITLMPVYSPDIQAGMYFSYNIGNN